MDKERLSTWWIRGLVFLLATSPSAIILWLQDILVPHVAGLSPETILRIGAALLLTVTFLGAWLILQSPWLKWDEPTGTWLSRLTTFRYCAKCRAGKISSPLKNEITGWRCMHCQSFYFDPKRKKDATKALRETTEARPKDFEW